MTLQAEKPRITLEELQGRWEQSLDTRLATFAQTLEARYPKPVPAPPAVPLAAGGVLAPIESVIPTIGGLPLGAMAVGGVTGLLVGELIDGFISPLDKEGKTNMTNIVAKGIGAVVFATQGKRLMSPTAANFGAFVLALQLARDILPIDDWIEKIVGWTRPKESQQEFYNVVHANGAVPSAAYNQQNPTGIPSIDKLASMFG